MALFKDRTEKEMETMKVQILVELEHIYGNKSSDEYKMHGDITKSKVYKGIETMLANLPVLKGFPKNDAQALKNMFNTLHRPIYKQMVSEYIHKPNERNSMFTMLFTCGYRVLVAELSRIFASTVATDRGLVYKPDRISRNKNAHKFIVMFNADMEAEVDREIRKNQKQSLQLKTEAYVYETAIGNAFATVAGFITAHELIAWINGFNDLADFIFGRFDKFNPVSFINCVLSDHYDKKVQAFYDAESMYEETKAAYEEYLKIPESNRSKKVESKYVKNMKKYNMRMENLRAKIAHYDQRAEVETNDKKRQKPSGGKGKPNGGENSGQPSTPDDINTTPGDDVNTPTDDIDW